MTFSIHPLINPLAQVVIDDEVCFLHPCGGFAGDVKFEFAHAFHLATLFADERHRVQLLKREIIEFYQHYRVGHHLIELRNLVTVAELIVDSALARQESRGLHYTLDFPATDAVASATVLTP